MFERMKDWFRAQAAGKPTKLDMGKIRAESIQRAKRLGAEINPHLPLLDEMPPQRSTAEVFGRLMAVHVTAAASFGFDRTRGLRWLEREGFTASLTPGERAFLETGEGPVLEFRALVESAWALFWALGLIPEMPFDKTCSDDFVTMLPNVKVDEPSATLRARAALRTAEEMIPVLDLAYCLHWAAVDASLAGRQASKAWLGQVVVQRRLALEWIFCEEDWDDVPMDT